MEPSYPSPRRNLELKARDRDPARSLQVCRDLGAEDNGTLVQQDTYFEVPRGRLKLREEPDVVATLIASERPDLSGNKESRYRLVEVPEPVELRAAFDIRDEDLVRASYSDLLTRTGAASGQGR
ncbi:MAG: hypothetical protein ACRDPE_08015 [Solirubrobacterales bacterium]